MDTTLNDIDLMAKELQETLTDFMLNHSRIDPPRFEEVTYLTPEGDRSYDHLDETGRKIQSALSKSYARFNAALHPFVKDQADDVQTKLSKLSEVVVRTIEHRLTWCENTKQALDLALAALEDQIKLVKTIYEGSSWEN